MIKPANQAGFFSLVSRMSGIYNPVCAALVAILAPD